MSKKDDFISPQKIDEARRNQPNLTSNPKFQRISDEATRVMQEVEDVFYQPDVKDGKVSGAKILDENIALIMYIVDHNPSLDREIIRKKFMSLKPGEYLTAGFDAKAFMRTPDNKVQEVASYVNRLEKATISVVGQARQAEKERDQLRTELAEERARKSQIPGAIVSSTIMFLAAGLILFLVRRFF